LIHPDTYGRWCLLAGAAEGLGRAYALALARRGMDLIMVDHQEEKLHDLAGRLERDHGIHTQRLCLDLAGEGSLERIMEAVHASACRLLVYNAAYSKISSFQDLAPDELDRFIRVNARMPMELLHRTLHTREKEDRQPMGFLLMASMAGLWGSNFLAPYGATKAFNILLAEALHHELISRQVHVMACVAGPVATPAYLSTQPRYGRIRPPVMHPESVAEAALEQLGKRALYIPGRMNRFLYFLMTRLLSRKRSARLFSQTTAKMYQ